MSVTVISGQDRTQHDGTFGAVNSITVSTATTRQFLDPSFYLTEFLASTATSGPNVTSIYYIPGATGGGGKTPAPGMEMWLRAAGTGPAVAIGVESLATTIHFGSLTTSSDDQRFISAGTGLYGATGVFVFSMIANNALWLKYMGQQWWVMGGFASEATGT